MNFAAEIAEQGCPLVLIRREVAYFRRGKTAKTGCPTEVGSSGIPKLKRTNKEAQKRGGESRPSLFLFTYNQKKGAAKATPLNLTIIYSSVYRYSRVKYRP